MRGLFHRWHEVEEPGIRPPAVAGLFYPGDPTMLRQMIEGFLARAVSTTPEPPAVQDLRAIIVPHAGYVYSGPVAAHAYAVLKGRRYDRVVVMAPSHFEDLDFSSVYDGSAYRTPLGAIPVDQAFAHELAARFDPTVQLSAIGHALSRKRPEHALETQLPFLQCVLGAFRLVPIVMGCQDYPSYRTLGVALAKLIGESNTLIVASSDLSHYHPYDDAVLRDRKTLDAIAEYDYLNLARNIDMRVREACGAGPIIASMIAAERLGASEARVLRYANSGDATGDHGQVVGYGAVALLRSAEGRWEEALALTEPEKGVLLEIARRAVEMAVREGKLYECPTGVWGALARERGAFVTLTRQGQLRGCIGSVAARKPLYLTVRDMAISAAITDSRFDAVTAAELADLEYEISILSPLRRVRDVSEVRIGVHGLLIQTKHTEGLLLPQVAIKAGWDVPKFLQHICVKAGLPSNAWQDPDADLFRFTALAFRGR